jgi:cell division protein FtsB
LEHAGFKSVFHGVPLEDRITRRGDGRYPDATVDYVFARDSDFLARPRIVASDLSGHFPVACEAIIKPAAPAAIVPRVQPVARWQSISFALFVVLCLFCWWWWVGRKRVYSPALALVEEAGSANLLSYPEEDGPVPDLPETIDGLETDGEWLPARARPDAARSQIQSLEKRAAAAEQRARQATDLVRQGLIPYLARLMKDRLFRGVASQRAQLLLTQQAGTIRMAELEQRLAKITSQMQNRFGAYERRIAELEKEVIAKEQLNRELIEAKAQMMKETLETERIPEAETERI